MRTILVLIVLAISTAASAQIPPREERFGQIARAFTVKDNTEVKIICQGWVYDCLKMQDFKLTGSSLTCIGTFTGRNTLSMRWGCYDDEEVLIGGAQFMPDLARGQKQKLNLPIPLEAQRAKIRTIKFFMDAN